MILDRLQMSWNAQLSLDFIVKSGQMGSFAGRQSRAQGTPAKGPELQYLSRKPRMRIAGGPVSMVREPRGWPADRQQSFSTALPHSQAGEGGQGAHAKKTGVLEATIPLRHLPLPSVASPLSYPSVSTIFENILIWKKESEVLFCFYPAYSILLT